MDTFIAENKYSDRYMEYVRTIDKIESTTGIQTISYLLHKETGLTIDEYTDIAFKIKAKQKSLELLKLNENK